MARKRRKGGKAEGRADDLARQQRAREDALSQSDRQRGDLLAEQQRARAVEEQRRQESDARLEQARLERLTSRTPEQTARLQSLQQQAALTGDQLFRQLGPTADQFATMTQQRLASPPQIAFQDTLAPELQLARQQVAAMANQRGMVGSGLELEQLGRAGVDLAIKQAGLRQQNAELNQQLIQETLNRAGGLSEFESGLGSQAQDRLGSYLQALRGQELGGVQAGEDALQAGLNRGVGVFGQGQGLGASAQEQGQRLGAFAQQQGEQLGGRFNELGLQALDQREREARSQQAQLMQLLGSTAFAGAAGAGGFLTSGLTGGQGALSGIAGRLTNTGAFNPNAGLVDFLLNARRTQIPTSPGQTGFHGAGYRNYPADYLSLFGNP